MPKTLVVYHAADHDGIFCREIARKFLPDAELIGWDHGNKPIPLHGYPAGQLFYILDLPVDGVFGMKYPDIKTHEFINPRKANLRWLDHHKSSIDTHPADIPGYRIDGVAACRLAWQWFSDRAGDPFGCHLWSGRLLDGKGIPTKDDFIERKVSEPWAVRLAGEHDIWDHRDPNAELFQHGLRSEELFKSTWEALLDPVGDATVNRLLNQGRALQYARTHENESIIKELGFTFKWEGGLTFLCCNAARYNSLLFTAGLKPEHDACFGFKWTGKDWSVSLYHAPGKEHHDLSVIAVKHGGGGHRGSCGFRLDKLPFLQ